jgi:phosphoglycolate phosphatase
MIGGGMKPFLVFDLDGTLIDSQRDLADAANALVAEHGGRALTEDEVARMVGEGAAVLVQRALRAAGLDPGMPGALARFLALYQERLTDHTRPYAGIPEALDTLRSRGHSLAVLTNKPQHATETILTRLELARAFSAVVGGDTAAGRKPDPAGLQRLIEGAGADRASTVLIGDSPVDLETARRGGTRICLARYGFGYRFDASGFRGDEMFVETPAEIVDRLA